MFIENLMKICDQILRRAAEENPGKLWWEESSSIGNEKQTQTPKGGN